MFLSDHQNMTGVLLTAILLKAGSSDNTDITNNICIIPINSLVSMCYVTDVYGNCLRKDYSNTVLR